MAENKNETGKIVWHDLTIGNAEQIKDFYNKVIGWKATDHSMGEYNDYDIHLPESGDVVAGICHARGTNANLPAQWLAYVEVENAGKSAELCRANGGKIIDGPRKMGEYNFCVIQDPAGAVIALISK
jgi:predicted enzyme related to lactoylglutathione lyase